MGQEGARKQRDSASCSRGNERYQNGDTKDIDGAVHPPTNESRPFLVPTRPRMKALGTVEVVERAVAAHPSNSDIQVWGKLVLAELA